MTGHQNFNNSFGDGKQAWYLCDKDICLYDAATAERRGMMRCIKHGAILNGAWFLHGMNRMQARAKLQDRLTKVTT